MKVKAWLVIEVDRGPHNWRDDKKVKITKVLQNRPENQMAVEVVLDIDPAGLQPAVEVLVPPTGISVLVVEHPSDSEVES